MLNLPPKIRKKQELGPNLKVSKGFHPVIRTENPLFSKKVDCTRQFKSNDKNTSFMVQYYHSMTGSRELLFDIRMFPRDDEPKRLCDTVCITSTSGRIGIRKIIDFVNENKDKFIKIRKSVIKTIKDEKKRVADELDPNSFKKSKRRKKNA